MDHLRIAMTIIIYFLSQILDRCSLVTFATYLSHKDEAWLFLEAPEGLPDKEKAGKPHYITFSRRNMSQNDLFKHP